MPSHRREQGSSDFNISDLIDLALCSPEVGAVNFNILRMLLRNIVVKTGIDKEPANVNDVEANQVEKFKNYVDGSGGGTGTPMPGVLKIGPSHSGGVTPSGGYGTGSDGGLSNSAKLPGQSGPGASQQRGHGGSSPHQQGDQDGSPAPPQQHQRGKSVTLPPPLPQSPGQQGSQGEPRGHQGQTPRSNSGHAPGFDPRLADRVAKLEKHLEALYQLPTNNEILERAKTGGEGAMSVSDMWQIIQLNNRIAAAEAAIQKMASLIEDLAKSMGKVKTDNKSIKKDAEDLQIRKSDLQIQGQELSEKCEKFADVVDKLQKDMNHFRHAWKRDRDNIQKVLGTELGKLPSFMKQEQGTGSDQGPRRQQPPHEQPQEGQAPVRKERGSVDGTPKETREEYGSDKGDGASSSGDADYAEDTVVPDQSARGTQTFALAKEADKGKPPTTGGKKSHWQTDQQAQSQSRGDQEQPEQQRERERQTKSQGQPPRRKPKEGMISPDKIATMTGAEIVENITPQEALQIPAEAIKGMSQEQKKALYEVRKSAVRKSEPQKPPMGMKNMTKEQIKEISPAKIAEKMGYEEAVSLPPELLEAMNVEQREAIQKIIAKGPPPKKATSRRDLKSQTQPTRKTLLGVAEMKGEDIQEVTPEEIVEEMSYEEAKALSPEVLEKMTPAQRAAVKKVLEAGPEATPAPPQRQQKSQAQAKRKTSIGVADMNKEELQMVEPDEIEATMSYEEAKSVPEEVLQQMTPEQQEAVQHVVEAGPEPIVSPKLVDDYAPSKSKGTSKFLTIQEIQDLARIPAKDLSKSITPEQAASIPQEELEELFSPNQIKEIEQIRENRKTGAEKALEVGQVSGPEEMGEYAEDQYDEELQPTTDYDDEESVRDEAIGTGKIKKKSFKERPKPTPSRHREREREKQKLRKHRGGETEEEIAAQQKHTSIDIVPGPIPTTGAQLPPVTLEDYLSGLSPEEAANLASDAVQRELQKQYQHLQGMQRKLASDIQEKMEFIYQKLLKEIAAQQMTTSPYMAVGGPEECLGPGICTGHGMPAGIAVCQFPEAKDKKAALPDGKLCPGPGVCPGSDICSYCRADAKIHDALQVLKKPGRKFDSAGELYPVDRQFTDVDGAIQEMKSLVMLDLEKIREEMRSRQFGAYDEQDILERLSAVWEALKILQRNEEALAVKIARQDALFKKIPVQAIEKLNNIPDENLDALVTGDFLKPTYVPDGSKRSTITREAETVKSPEPHSPSASASGDDKEDIQSLFNNLANVIAECTSQKDRIDQLADTTRILESGMVTKQMLMDIMSDKADKGLINTKVSYDEFGNTIDELHNQLHNLMVEGYQRNENWKKVTSDMAEELSAKLDKMELAPIRAFFKSHLKTLEEKVKNVTDLMEEPDSAGTRKKLLRDYNCLSCDRMVNISGVTQGPTLPVIGPIPAGHQAASKRALDLHRMRMLKKIDPNNKNLNALEKQGRGIRSRADKKGTGGPNPAEIANDMDIMNVINRYSGGSHTNVTNADLIAAQRRKTSDEIDTAGAVRRSNNADISEADTTTSTSAPPLTTVNEPIIDAVPSIELMIMEE